MALVVVFQVTLGYEASIATIASVRTLAGMTSQMDHVVPSLHESLLAAFVLTHIRSYLRTLILAFMKAFMNS